MFGLLRIFFDYEWIELDKFDYKQWLSNSGIINAELFKYNIKENKITMSE